jgi:hypothetical protein
MRGGDRRQASTASRATFSAPSSPNDPRELLGVERVAAGPVEERRLNLRRQHRAFEDVMNQHRRLLLRER